MEQANLLELPEEEFSRLIVEIEKSPLFQRLYHRERIIRYQGFPRADISPCFCELKDDIVADSGSLDVESLLEGREDIVRLIKRLGLDRFKRYFLFPEPELAVEDIARECDLDIWEVQRVNDLVDDFSVMSEFYHPSALGATGSIHYSKTASVERGPEGFIIGYFSPSNARGRYSIDHERFEELTREALFTGSEAREIKQLLKRLELVNSRKDTVHRILENIVDKQALYLESGDSRALLPFTQKELAHRIGIFPSSISRAICGRSLDTPWGEKPLKDFFPRPKRFRKDLIRQLLEAESEPLSDEGIRRRLDKEFGISVSRRSVASLRNELGIPTAWKRRKDLPRKGEET
jgi:transposase